MTEDERQRLIKLMNLTTSDNDGEALNALRAANRILAKNDLRWEVVLAHEAAPPVPPPRPAPGSYYWSWSYAQQQQYTPPDLSQFWENLYRAQQEAEEKRRRQQAEELERLRKAGLW